MLFTLKSNKLNSESMKLIKAIILSAFLFSSLAFKSVSEPDFIGTYGISKNYPGKLELKINADKTFTYQDFSDPNNKIEARGTWELEDNKIILQDHTATFPYRSKWKIEKDGRAVRSRKGLEFIRFAKF
jgi:hypothetical protein